MRLLSYWEAGTLRAGIEEDGQVLDAAAVHDFGAAPPTVRRLLEAEPERLAQTLGRAADTIGRGGPGLRSLDLVRLGPPVPDPDKIICLGYNYAEHARESEKDIPVAPNLFAKFRNCLVGRFDPVRLPAASREVDYEGELAVVIGRRCRDVDESRALEFVAGYSVLDDVSARDLQYRTGQYTAGKALDTFAPMGPGIALAASVPDPQRLRIVTRLNGEIVQDGNTAEMVFSVAATIGFISSLITLEPGDVIATGTPTGVGHRRVPPVYLRPGDTVEVEIEGVGSISNPIVAPEPRRPA
ncbi:MAG: fumarylacetoacetate hydrolase family protein [Candidatus Dormibacteraceae bacterium]